MRYPSHKSHHFSHKQSATLFILFLLLMIFPFIVKQTGEKQDMSQHAAGTTATVTLNPATTTNTISPDFAGLSVETNEVCGILNLEKSTPILDKLFLNLSPSVIRYGGGSVDGIGWNPTGSCGSSISRSTIDNVISFAKKVNWTVIWGVNIRAKDPATYTDEAAYAIQAGGPTLLAVDFGNEYELFPWNYATLKPVWESYYSSLTAKIPHPPLGGSDTCCGDTTGLGSFMNDEGTKVTLGLHHIYEAGVNGPSQTITKILSPALMSASAHEFDQAVTPAKAKNVPMEVDETSSIANGGTVGVSDTFASALWGVDYLFTGAEHGIVRMNFHGDGGSIEGDTYSPLTSHNHIPYARPLYYAMLLFHYAAPNGRIVPIQITSPVNLAAHAVLNDDGKLRVILINKDQTNSVTAQINTTKPYMNVSALRLTAPSVSTTTTSNMSTYVKFGGAAVSPDGTWSPGPAETVSVNGASSSVDVPAASAIVITYEAASGASPTPTSTSTPVPSLHPSVTITPTPPVGGTPLSVTVCPHGLGNCGDNVNPNSGGTTQPHHTARTVTVAVFNSAGQQIATGQGSIPYNSSSQNFQGTISLSTVSSGQYIVSEKMDGFLSKQVPGIITITQGQLTTLPSVSVVTGDVNNDNQLDLLDYNILIGCFGSKQQSASCTTPITSQSPGADINDDSAIDGIDYNLFLRELSVQKGG